MNHKNSKIPGQRKQRDNIFLIVVVLIFGPIFLFSYIDSKRIKESFSSPEQQYETAGGQAPLAPAPVNKPESFGGTESVPDKTYSITDGKINLSIAENGFVPVEFRATASSSVLNIQLTQEPSGAIRKLPAFKGREQWYGYMDLGNRANKRFHFVLDQKASTAWLLYFDKNNNGDLTDDGAPIRNQGSGAGGPGGFACIIALPWPVLIEGSRFEGDFNIWFFSNTSGWEQDHRVSHYSHTQLQGNIRIADRDYLAMLIDQGYNDADLTNDGIAIDLNRNGKIDRDESPRKVHKINGQTYEFNVSW